jgi:hypothetical protein
MNYKFTFSLLLIIALFFPIQSQTLHVVPSTYATVAGPNVFTGPYSSTVRTYQMIFHADMLTPLVGQELKGIYFRSAPTVTGDWPAADVTVTDYDIFMGPGVAPANRTSTYATNFTGTVTQVRSGSHLIPAGSLGAGSPAPWGPEINFTTPYLYTGGHLTLEIKMTGSGTSRSVDAIGTTAATGYGTMFAAYWTGSLNPVTGTQGNFAIVRFRGEDVVPVELSSFTAAASNNSVNLNWTTQSETNNKGFEVQRKGNESWITLGYVDGAGTTTEQQNYIYTDVNVSSGTHYYRLKQLDYDGSFEYSNEVEVDVIVPQVLTLHQNYPNPFNPSTVISFSLPQQSFVTLKILNLLGEEVATPLASELNEGIHSVNFDGTNLSSGIYIYRLTAGNKTLSSKMLLTK